MDFFEAVNRRRSIRRYTDKAVPSEVMKKAFEAAQLAPNSSNLQTSEFWWVKTPEIKKQLAEACLGQNAARTAQELVVVLSVVSNWKRNNQALLQQLEANPSGAIELQRKYYGKLIPFLYGYHWLGCAKKVFAWAKGLTGPSMRRPTTSRDVEEVSIKSAALAAENFMLAISAQGFDSCPMEGFDEVRVKKCLGRSDSCRVVMVVSVGERSERGVWGERFRFPLDWFVKEI